MDAFNKRVLRDRLASSNTDTFARISATEIWALHNGCARLCGGCE
jgi:hypothetical protein